MIEERNGTAIILDRDRYGITISANTIAHHVAAHCPTHGVRYNRQHLPARPCRLHPRRSRQRALTIQTRSRIVSSAERPSVRHAQIRWAAMPARARPRYMRDIAITGNMFMASIRRRDARDGCTRLLIANNLVTDVNRAAPPGTAAIVLGDASECIVKDHLDASAR